MGQDVLVYIDGVSQDLMFNYDSGELAVIDSGTAFMAIGRTYYGSGGASEPSFDGDIDDVRIYQRVLSPPEIAQLAVDR